MIVYISGPMGGLTNYNRDSFAFAERILTDKGYQVRNPACLPDGWDYEDYMTIDLAMLAQCDKIIQLPGSHNSPGAKRELEKAKELGLPLIHFDHAEQESLRLKWLSNGGVL